MGDTKRKKPVELLTQDEIRALLAQCSRRAPTGIRDRALITVMYRAGLRVEEVLALRPSDIDATAHTVRVLHGKGDKSRTVGIDDGALAAVQLWLEARKSAGINGTSTKPLFCTITSGNAGHALSANQVRQMLRRRACRAGIEHRVHPHQLRHTYAGELSREGVPVDTIRKALGHSSLATTDVYLGNIAPADVIAVGRSRQWSEEQPSTARVERTQHLTDDAATPAQRPVVQHGNHAEQMDDDFGSD